MKECKYRLQGCLIYYKGSNKLNACQKCYPKLMVALERASQYGINYPASQYDLNPGGNK